MRGWRSGCGVGAFFDQPEDADNRFAALSWTELTSTGTRVPWVETSGSAASLVGEVPSIF